MGFEGTWLRMAFKGLRISMGIDIIETKQFQQLKMLFEEEKPALIHFTVIRKGSPYLILKIGRQGLTGGATISRRLDVKLPRSGEIVGDTMRAGDILIFLLTSYPDAHVSVTKTGLQCNIPKDDFLVFSLQYTKADEALYMVHKMIFQKAHTGRRPKSDYPKSLVDQMKDVLDVAAEMEKESYYVKEAELYKALQKRKGMTEEGAKYIVTRLIKDGIIYSPEEGLLKRTSG